VAREIQPNLLDEAMPQAAVTGIDTSADIAAEAANGVPGQNFIEANIAHWVRRKTSTFSLPTRSFSGFRGISGNSNAFSGALPPGGVFRCKCLTISMSRPMC